MSTKADGIIPILGFGTYQLSGDNAVNMVSHALRTGYRHIDTAQAYENEAEVGHAILSSGLPRAHVFVTTKVWPNRFGQQDLPKSVDESLQKLGTDYIDLLLLHWPNPHIPLEETLDALVEVKKAGKTRHIGVSNFTTDLMQRCIDICGKGTLINNQVEYHPFLDQDVVIRKAHDLDMSVTAYRPIAKGRVFKNDTISDMAKRHQKSAAQVTLRWIVQQGIVAIPRSSKADHVSENFQIFDFELSAQEMKAISALRGDHRLVSPSNLAPDWDEPEPALSRG
jgi:2,5-diketo-D-gluconate reductase B